MIYCISLLSMQTPNQIAVDEATPTANYTDSV